MASSIPLVFHHCTSHPYRFFGRAAEIAMLDGAVENADISVVALIGPGGQGKTAILQTWVERFAGAPPANAAGVFFWSFYRGKDSDHCLRELFAAVTRLDQAPDVSATYCVDHLLPLLRERCWIVALDGSEVVQYDSGPWQGRFVHPELGRLIEELASAPAASAVLLTSRFPIPSLEYRFHARLVSLATLDSASARSLLRALGIEGDDAALDAAAEVCGFHAKAVELLGTYLKRFHAGQVQHSRELPDPPPLPGSSELEHRVTRVLAAFQSKLPRETQDILALATAFREPVSAAQLFRYLESSVIDNLLHSTWGRTYEPFQARGTAWLIREVQDLVDLRLLERVRRGASTSAEVLDAHPLVRRAFEHALGASGCRESAQTRAGFLSGRPERRRAATLEEAREDIELFHAYCEAELWEEAHRTLLALDKPRYRFLAPALERDLILRFFPKGDWHRPPRWFGFPHYRSLAICFELLGQFEDALSAYHDGDAPLRGDALLALGQLQPFLATGSAPHPWQMLWQAYQVHALSLAGRLDEAVALARRLVPGDVYEWTHVFESLLRAGRLDTIDMRAFLERATASRWEDLARQRIRADYRRISDAAPFEELEATYRYVIGEYDRGGMPWERGVARLGYARLLLGENRRDTARAVNSATLDLARRSGMRIIEADAWRLETALSGSEEAAQREKDLRETVGYFGPSRP